MPIHYISYDPDPIQGQALLNNFTRAQRALKYRDNDMVFSRIARGLPMYEVEAIETVGKSPDGNLLIRGECVSACAYLKQQGIKVDLVYIDPPFASGADYAKKIYLRRNPKVAQAIEKAEQEMEDDERGFEEKMYGDIWNKEAYLNWMYENLYAIKNIMSETGSIYVHLDWHIGHYVKILMDEVFGEDNFRNEIVVRRTKKNIRETEYVRSLNIATDSIYFYATNDEVLLLPPSKEFIKDERWHSFDAPNWSGNRPNLIYKLFGKMPPGGRCWLRPKDGADELMKQGRLRPNAKTGKPEYLLDATTEMTCDSLWDDISAYSFQNDYSTEKSPDLLRRIIEASSYKGMVVADFFGGSGVTAKVAHDLGRTFIHVDVGINSIQTARDRLKAAKASFDVLEVKDGVELFRNPAQTMDKLKSLINGLGANKELDKFWAGGIQDSKKGLIPVFLPNLLDHTQKILDTPLLNRILNGYLPDLPDDVEEVHVYFVDLEDQKELKKFIRDYNPTLIKVELLDLKNVLHDVVANDEVKYKVSKGKGGVTIEFTRFYSDRLAQKIDAYNQKRELNSGRDKQIPLGESREEESTHSETDFKPIEVSENGLELIEMISLDCTSATGKWHSDMEIKIDKKGYVIRDGEKTKEFWDGKITSAKKPLRMKVRNIAGDETVVEIK